LSTTRCAQFVDCEKAYLHSGMTAVGTAFLVRKQKYGTTSQL
jgi:hypothetical protein